MIRCACFIGGLGAALVAALVPTGAARADSLIVADARGGGLKPGQTIDAAQPIKLEPGQRVTLIASNGATIKLSGPFEGVPDPTGTRSGGVAAALLQLASQNTQSTATLGSVRAPSGSGAPEPWLVDVSAGGHRCVAEPSNVVLWRPPAATDRTLQLSPVDHAWQGSASWPAGADQLRLPASFQAEDDAAYVFALDGAAATITFHVVPPAASSDAMRAAWMLEKGCTTQARLIVSRLK